MTCNPKEYDRIILCASGGKDSWACLIELLDQGVDHRKIEWWHHLVDGKDSTLFDWPCTEDYCRKAAEAFEIEIYYSWLEGGLERELNRDGQPKAPTWFETPYGLMKAGGKGKPGKRLRFPQQSGQLDERWCSPYAKIDVHRIAIRNQERFENSRTLVITGERAEESPARAKYAVFETHQCDERNGKLKRHVDQWRPVHTWTRERVWEAIASWGIHAHPAYYLGWGRLSCMKCIFGSKNQWASNYKLDPSGTQKIINYETSFGVTINRNKKSLSQLIEEGIVYASMPIEYIEAALSKEYRLPILMTAESWILPSGAYGENNGPS